MVVFLCLGLAMLTVAAFPRRQAVRENEKLQYKTAIEIYQLRKSSQMCLKHLQFAFAIVFCENSRSYVLQKAATETQLL